MHNRITMIIVQCVLALWVSACGSLEIGIEHVPPTGNVAAVDWQATAEVLQAEATRANGNVQAPSPLLAVEPVPTMVPNIVVPPASDVPMVAYVQGGDIWIRSVPNFANRLLDDGNAVRLTFDGRNQSPRWSANGEMISFVKNPDAPELWVVRRDGSVVSQIGLVSSWDAYDWSPVEDKLVLVGNGRVLFYEISATNGTQLVANVDIGASQIETRMNKVVWSPNGQHIAFTLYTQLANMTDDEADDDGLWVINVASNTPEKVLASEIPEKGEILLQGWSGDGEYLIYSQSPILSAPLLSDGVPLYRVPAFGGEPMLMAESVVPHADSVQSQPNGLSQVAFVEGSGREMWHNKRLRSVVVTNEQSWELTPADQAVSSPVWSPSGKAIAYIAMPDVEGVGGGDDAQMALMQRQLWIVEENQAARKVGDFGGTRLEAPQWIDNETLLVAAISIDGRAGLVKLVRSGSPMQAVVPELTPAPEWFGFYGHIDWSNYFAVWRPPTAAVSEGAVALIPTAVPYDPYNRKLVNFLQALHPEMTSGEAISLFGEPDDITGSGLLIYQYLLNDGVLVWLAFPGQGPLTYAQLHTPTGKVFGLDFMVMDPTSATSTPTPASVDAAPLTPTIVPPTAPPPGPMPVPTATPVRVVVTLTPTPMPQPTAIPLATPTPVPQ